MVIGISGNDLTVLCGYMGKQRTCFFAVKKQIILIFILMLLSFFQQIWLIQQIEIYCIHS